VLADLILPDHSFLESWVHSTPESGAKVAVASVAGPVMQPLHDTRSTPDVILDIARRLKKPIVLSYHNFEKTASVEELSNIVSQAQKRGSVVKISTFIHSPSDVKTLEALLQKKWDIPLCVIGMGPLGSSTRITLACAGSCLTYGYIDAPVAPGQLSARTLVEQLRRMIPAFDDDFIQRGGVRTG